jgi:hypothetical protein
MSNTIADIDKRDPSGLRPRWIALGLIVVAFGIWVIVAGMLGGT